ncbi:response regulator [Rhodobacterales bacterium HKCCE3408]|nr:response regulator [Rhodobacterales bacterium HKCCE3408]
MPRVSGTQTGQDRLQSLLDATGVAVFIVARDGAVTPANRAARDMSADRPIDAHPVEDIRSGAGLSGAAHPVARLIADPVGGTIFASHVDRAGQRRMLRFRAVGWSDPEGGAERILTIDDETEGWRLREALDRIERFEAISRLSSGVAHEASNIIGAIRLAADTGLLGDPPARLRRQLEAIQIACDRGADLTGQLLAMSDEAEGPAARTDAVVIIAEALELARVALPARIEIERRLPEGPVPVDCHPAGLETAVLTLVLRIGPHFDSAKTADGRIRVAATHEAGWLRISVADESAQASALPDRADDQAWAASSLGLGSVDRFAGRLGGAVTLDQRPGRGMQATLELPVAAASAKGSATDVPDQTGIETDAFEGLRVLVVEDDPLYLDRLTEALETLGCNPVRARDGAEAIALVEGGEAVDILLTDVLLPGDGDGFALARRVVGLRPGLGVIYISGFAGAPGTQRDLVPGPFLRKPLGLSALPEAMREVLTQSTHTGGSGDPTS